MKPEEFERRLDEVFADIRENPGVFDGNKHWDSLMKDLAAEAIAEARAIKAARQANA